MWSFYRFVRQSVPKNVPWDRFARSIVTAQGSTLANGAANFFVLHRDPIDLTENTSMAFLGLSLTCRRCHNHPLEKWTQDQYYGFANLFARIKLKDGETAGDEVVANAEYRRDPPSAPRSGDAGRGRSMAGPIVAGDPRDRRAVFADWLARPDNPYFAKAAVNRVWSNFFGRGLVDPEDDLRVSNPPSDEALLDWLVADFVAHRFDIKHLIKTIMTSAATRGRAVPVAGNEQIRKFLSHYRVKRLPAEVLLDAIAQVTEVPTAFTGYPAGWRHASASRQQGRERVPRVVRPAGAAGHVFVRAVGGAVDGPGPAPGQWDDDQREAPLRLQRRRQGDRAATRATRLSSIGRHAAALLRPLPPAEPHAPARRSDQARATQGSTQG